MLVLKVTSTVCLLTENDLTLKNPPLSSVAASCGFTPQHTAVTEGSHLVSVSVCTSAKKPALAPSDILNKRGMKTLPGDIFCHLS